MQSTRLLWWWALILALAFLSLGICNGSTSTVDPTSSDDEEEKEVASTHVPKFLSKALTISILPGETATFPCEVDDLGTFATVWKKEDTVLFANSIRILRDQHYHRLEDRSLQVRKVRPTDSGNYICVISSNPTVDLKHTLIVQIPPKITSKIKEHITITKGQPLSLNCEASGNPPPTITWKRLGGAFADDRSIHEGGVLYTAHSTRHQAGTYECLATNGVGEPATQQVKVHVNFAPEVEPVSSWVHAGEERSAELTCKVRAHPMPTVTWRSPNGSPISESDHYRFKYNGGNHTLQIRQMMKEDFGKYQCQASNKEGETSATIIVSGVASPAEFKSDPQGELPDSYVLKWITRSHSIVIDYKLRIKQQNGNDEWVEVIVPAVNQQGLLKSQNYEVTGLKAATSYEAEVVVHNEFGDSEPSRTFVFFTQGAAEPQQHSTDDSGTNAAPLPPNSKKLSSLLTVIILSVFFWY